MMTFFWKRRAANKKKDGANGIESEAIEPKMGKAGAAQDDAAGDVDVVARGNEIADDVEDHGHGFSREDVSEKKMLGRKVRKASWMASDCVLALLETRMPIEERDEEIGQRKKRKNQNIAVDGNLKDEAHKGKNQAEFGKNR